MSTELCAICETQPADGDDPLCPVCRVEVTAASQVVTDPVELVLNAHLPVIRADDWTMCICGERIEGGPGHHRRHVAVLIREALGLEPPAAWVPAATYDDPEPTP